MGKTRARGRDRPSGGILSPSSSSSSDFEFTVSLSPSSRRSAAQQCPADELFYKGQLLPLHLSPRISMVRTLILASSSSSSSSSDATTTASRDSNGSSSSSSSFSAADLLILPPDCDSSSRPSSVTEEDANRVSRRPKYFSSIATRFSSVFLHRGSKKDPADLTIPPPPSDPTKKSTNPSSAAKEAIKKYYVKKVKPLYEKLSSLQDQKKKKKNTFSFSVRRDRHGPSSPAAGSSKKDVGRLGISFSGNLKYPRRSKCAGSCPSSMRSSPTHSGLLSVSAGNQDPPPAVISSSSMDELQSAIQGAIAHCKSTMTLVNQKKESPDEIRRS